MSEDIKQIYTDLARLRNERSALDALAMPKTHAELSEQIERLESICTKSRDWRKRVLDDHNIEWEGQDEQVFALGTVNTATGVWVWDDVTTCNIMIWLGY